MAISYFETVWDTAATNPGGGQEPYKDLAITGAQVGDLIVVIALAENYGQAAQIRTIITQAGGTTGAWTLSQPAVVIDNDIEALGGYALVTGAGTVTVRAEVRVDAGAFMGVGAFLIPAAEVGSSYGWLGTGGNGFVGSANGLFSATLAAISTIIYGAGDWNVVNMGTTPTPAGGTVRRNQVIAGRYSVWLANWLTQATGTRNYGPSGVSGGDISGVVFRMDTAAAGIPQGGFSSAYTYGPASSSGDVDRKGNFGTAYTFGAASSSGQTPKRGGFASAYSYGPAAAQGEIPAAGSFSSSFGYGPSTSSGEVDAEGAFDSSFVFGPAVSSGEIEAKGDFSVAFSFGPASSDGETESSGAFSSNYNFGPASSSGGESASGGFNTSFGFGPASMEGESNPLGDFSSSYAFGPATAQGNSPTQGDFDTAFLFGPAVVEGIAPASGEFSVSYAFGPGAWGGPITPIESSVYLGDLPVIVALGDILVELR